MRSHRALFAIPSLRCGGAERVFTLVLNGLAARGFDMHLALCQREGPWLERLSPAVTVHDLKAPRVRQAALRLARLTHSLKPRSILSTSFHLNLLAGLARPLFPRSTQVVLREVNINHFEPSVLYGLRAMIARRAYQAADRVICLADGMGEMVVRHLGVKPSRVCRIFNPIDGLATATDECRRPSGPKQLIAVGTLEHRKGFDRIISAMPRLLEEFPGSTLTIYGEGEERANLEAQAAGLQLSHAVRLPGFSRGIREALQSADLFILASRFEGVPNVLLESIAAGCPFVVVDHPGGTREVVERLNEQRRIASSLDEWRGEWFQPLSTETLDLAARHFGYEAILDQYASVLFPDAVSSRLAA